MNIEDKEKRAAVAAELFGEKAAYEMAPMLGMSAEEMSGMRQECHDLGIVMGEDAVKSGGLILVDSSLIERKVRRSDVQVCYVPATRLADANGTGKLANMILMGKLLDVLGDYNEETVDAALQKCISARHADMLELNRKAMEIGKNYSEEA